MGLFKGRKEKDLLERKFAALQNHFENNYKDAAHMAYDEAVELLAQIKAQNVLSARELEKYERRMDEFTEKMKNYTHYNHIGW